MVKDPKSGVSKAIPKQNLSKALERGLVEVK
jgi:hypothetical protein